MNSWTAACVLTALVNLVIAALVYVKNPRRLANRLFPLFSVNLAVWAIVVGFIMTAASEEDAGRLVRLAFAVGAFLPAQFNVLAIGVTRRFLERKHLWTAGFLYALSAAVAAVPFIPSFIHSVSFPSGRLRLPGPEVTYDTVLFSIYCVAVIVPMLAGLLSLGPRWNTATGVRRAELQYLFLGVLAGSLWVLATSLVPPFFGTTLPSRLAPFSSVVMSGIIAYGVAKYRILDIQVVLETTTAYVVTSLLLFFGYFMLVGAVSAVISSFWGGAQLRQMTLLVALFIVAATFVPFKSKVQYALRKQFFHDRYDPEELGAELNRVFGLHLAIGPLLERTIALLHDNMGIPLRATVLVSDELNVTGLFRGMPEWCGVRVVPESAVLRFLAHRQDIVVGEELEKSADPVLQEVREELTETEADAAVPILVNSSQVGALCIAGKVSGEMFSRSDMRILARIGTELGIAIERLVLADQLLKTQQFQSYLLEHAPIGVIATDERNTLTVFNREAEHLAGLSRETLIGHSPSRLPAPLRTVFEELLTAGKGTLDRELSVHGANGTRNTVRAMAELLTDERGSPVGAELILVDLSRVRQLEEQVRRNERLAALGVIAAGIAHEIRNPLVSLRTFAQLLPERYEDVEFRNAFSTIALREIDRMVRLVEDILLTRPGSCELREVDLVQVVKGAVVMFEAQRGSKEIVVRQEFPSQSVPVVADAERLHQAFLNILLNSRDAIEKKGEIVVRISETDEWVSILCEDNGCGMTQEEMRHMCDPFFTTKQRGIGLGLSIVAGIVQDHGGRLSVDSAKGVGTRLIIDLPRKVGKGASA